MPFIKKIFDYFIWLMFFGLLLLGGVIYATNRTYPGDYLYPFKLKFEGFVLATSKILNKQVDFSIDLVVKRSNETAKILASKYGKDSLDRLNIQVELTANSISQIADPIEKKKAAEKYIAKLNEVSSVLSEKQKDFAPAPPSSNITPQANAQQAQNVPTPTITPLPEISTVSQQIDNTQETIKQTIDKMTDLTTPMKNNQQENKNDNKSNNEKGEEKDKQNDQKNNDSNKETNEDREKNIDKKD